jgi:mercuric reductase
MAARNALLERDDHVDFRSLPRVIFTTPPVAASGLTEQQAADQGIVRECRVLPMSAVPRALVNRDLRGFGKIVAERDSRRVLGATMVADGAGDVIQAAVYAIQFRLTTDK